ncbi:MAG: hypothetical protein US50_C0046G0006 [Candidatus Nomurabacteria bacterium GW2011_GWB1_37_5]|uniref:Uncharacterized protein n=1 Tax=Candidatus Nomurabacteria bacterium GW2011_GWB1_37_5 TaxID=1618742 RepID=A0A0G0JCJ0_9BACT|nr:MAG: hypothetical protein US50_C0046G0006 [Candidatus Nomurabacteria bacterium GW2011_GWB1_37_5]
MREGINQNLTSKITARDKAEHEEKLRNEINKIQLLYADQLYQKKIKTGAKTKFFNILEDHGANIYWEINSIIEIENKLIEQENHAKHDKEIRKYGDFINHIYEELSISNISGDKNKSSEYLNERGKNIDKILEYVNQIRNESQKRFPEEWEKDRKKREERKKKEERAGIFEIRVSDKAFLSKKALEKLKDAGISKDGEFLQVHVPDIYLQDIKLTPAAIKESFHKVANIIVDKYPQIQAVIGMSWLLDHPITQKFFNFNIIDESNQVLWGQFIDKKGQIDQNKLSALLKTGDFPYKTLVGYIETVDFLKQYLPEEKKGRLILKEIDSSLQKKYAEINKKLSENSAKFVEKWNNGGIKNKQDILNYFDNEGKFIKEFCQDAGVFDDVINLWSENIGKKGAEVREQNIDVMKKLGEKVDKFRMELNNTRYKDKEVII